MKKLWINIAIYAVLTAAIVTLSAMCAESRKHLITLKNQVAIQSSYIDKQGHIIDSLLARRMTVFDVSLNVTDRSRSVIYGRYNKGTITMPQERKYILKIDSASVSIKN